MPGLFFCLGTLELRQNMAFDCFVQRDDSVLDFGAGHGDEPIPGILTVILQTPVLGAYGAQVPFFLDVAASMFVEFWVEAVFFPQQSVYKMKGSIEICRYNPV